MQPYGTPGTHASVNAMQQARTAAQEEITLLAMIRPRGGDFCYDEGEVLQMQHDIALAAQAGMQEVVLGALTRR
ncbi:copper homeostasis protein CutC [Paraglaciecola sp. Hal342]